MTPSLGILVVAIASASAATISAGGANPVTARHVPATVVSRSGPPVGPVHRIFGWLVSVNGDRLVLQRRNGQLLKVDAAPAIARIRVSQPLFRGKATVVTGTFTSGGAFSATAIVRAAPRQTHWAPDR